MDDLHSAFGDRSTVVPVLLVLVDVIGRYLGVQSTTAFYATCSLSKREELKNLLTNAGFQDVCIRLEVPIARFPLFDEFLSGYISIFLFAAEIAAWETKNGEKCSAK